PTSLGSKSRYEHPAQAQTTAARTTARRCMRLLGASSLSGQSAPRRRHSVVECESPVHVHFLTMDTLHVCAVDADLVVIAPNFHVRADIGAGRITINSDGISPV